MQFATYTRDSYSGLDYADQRYYASTYGRFLTADPFVAGGAPRGSVDNPGDPGTWNRFAYVGGDPVNRNDPRGTDWIIVNGEWCSTLDHSGGCYDPGYGDPESDGSASACPTADPGLISALQQSPNSPTFYAQLQAMGACRQMVRQSFLSRRQRHRQLRSALDISRTFSR